MAFDIETYFKHGTVDYNTFSTNDSELICIGGSICNVKSE